MKPKELPRRRQKRVAGLQDSQQKSARESASTTQHEAKTQQSQPERRADLRSGAPSLHQMVVLDGQGRRHVGIKWAGR